MLDSEHGAITIIIQTHTETYMYNIINGIMQKKGMCLSGTNVNIITAIF